MGSVVKPVTGLVSGLIGSGSDAGALGLGQFKGENYNINTGSVTDADVRSDAQQLESRRGQSDLVAALQAQLRGEGPSIAQDQLKEATDRNISQAMALAASGRGGNAALAQRQAQMAQAQAGQESARQSSVIRAQEQMSAQQQLGNALQGMRAQDIGAVSSDRDARSNLEGLQVQRATGLNQVNQAAYADTSKRRGDFLGKLGEGFAGGGGEGAGATKGILSMFGGSDKDNKDIIKSEVKSELMKFVEALNPARYEYKDDVKNKEFYGEGEYISPMAQDLEKTDLGKDMVMDTPEGKVVDYAKGFGTILASQSMLNDRLFDIEKALKLKNKKV